uniref:Isoprenyl transferase n=1 Tax=Leptospirillum ferriphilum TaxID=178606 RepID=A0A7C3QW04_9BACT
MRITPSGRQDLTSQEDSSSTRPGWLWNTPRHVAIIMDGNGRWARKRHLPRIVGHRAGASSVRTIVTAARKWEIPYLTLYAFSWENWSRPRQEVDGLMNLLEEYIDKEIRTMVDRDIRFSVVGDRSRLPASVRKKIAWAEGETIGKDRMVLTLALSYSGREEIVRAARNMAQDVQKGLLSPEKISESVFSRYLETSVLPPPDLLIRTSGEVRISNFFLWQLAYTEMYFTPTLWPDFGEESFRQAIEDFQERRRRFGKADEDIEGLPG